ncbi:dimethylarginine dimethylaminohydrolase family protein [Geomicrobium sp. JSM 1781026]|uniref:dimethylarginine dimethylaminohydrolase family protein n=1 Tax=Geomicrobium sp. JSM 1781026 TaxID=3344580 RepID=UPI0035C0C246
MFKQAIAKRIGKSFVGGLTTSDLGVPDYTTAEDQHAAYIRALKTCGVEVTLLEASESFPDSTFVEDTAVITKACIVITNPGAPSRNGETSHIERVLKQEDRPLEHIQAPGRLDGGDVLQVDNHFYVGLSERTDRTGAEQLLTILGKYGYNGTIIPLDVFFHLKTGISYLGEGNILVAGEFINNAHFSHLNQITVPDEEHYAANCIRVNDYVILPKGYRKTKEKIEHAGYETIEVEMSEFRKQDGGLSCLSLRY